MLAGITKSQMCHTMPINKNLILDPIAMSQNLKTRHSDMGEVGNWFLSESPSLAWSWLGWTGFKLGSCLVHELGEF